VGRSPDAWNGTTGKYLAIGFDGVEGTLNLGTTNSSGTIKQAPGSSFSYMEVRRVETAKGTLRGWGTCEITGSLRNDGLVIADGYGTDRDLDFTNLSHVTANSFVNTTTNGWYARNHGRVKLPDIAAGNPTYWGERDNQDLVNSVKLALSGSGNMWGTLLASDHGAVSNGLFKPIGVWEFTGPGTVGTGKLTFLYDAAGLAAMGVDENRLAVWRHDGTRWVNVTDDGGLDTSANTIRTSTVDPRAQFAVDPLPVGTMISVK